MKNNNMIFILTITFLMGCSKPINNITDNLQSPINEKSISNETVNIKHDDQMELNPFVGQYKFVENTTNVIKEKILQKISAYNETGDANDYRYDNQQAIELMQLNVCTIDLILIKEKQFNTKIYIRIFNPNYENMDQSLLCYLGIFKENRVEGKEPDSRFPNCEHINDLVSSTDSFKLLFDSYGSQQ